jgi:hypothetical protein
VASKSITVTVDTAHLRGQLRKAVEIVADLAAVGSSPLNRDRLEELRHRARQWVADEAEGRSGAS